MPTFWRTQQPCLEHAKKNADDVVFYTFLEGRRMYSSLPDKDAYACFLRSDEPGSEHCCELLSSDTHSYMDLDSPRDLAALGWDSDTSFMTAFNNLLAGCFKELLGIDITSAQVLWSTSTRPEKLSYHIKVLCLDKYWPAATRKTHMKSFFKHVEARCRDTEGFHWLETKKEKITVHTVVDTSVYSANRAMRSLTQKKPEHPQAFELPSGEQASHSDIVRHTLTVTAREKASMTAFVFKPEKKLLSQPPLHENIFRQLADNYGARYVRTEGSLVILKNKGKCRKCPIGNEDNYSDQCYFVLKDNGQSVYFGCHNADCAGKLHLAHSFANTGKFQHYADYAKLIRQEQVSRSEVQEYCKACIAFIDKPNDPHFVTTGEISLDEYSHKLMSSKVSTAKTLFKGYQDILIPAHQSADGERFTFGEVLQTNVQLRGLRTFSQAVWTPYTRVDVPLLPSTTLNKFQGFALERVPSTDIEFEKTQIFDLIVRLVGRRRETLHYFMSFMSEKLKRPRIKHPVALCFLGSREGNGKGTIAEWIAKLFCCGEKAVVSFNTLDAFKNGFNGIQAHALFLILEEVTAKRGGLHEYNGFLKDKISSTSICCELKGKEREILPWHANIVIFSNEFNVMTISRHDRRLALFESDCSIANNTEYFTKAHQELSSIPHMKAAYDYLLAYDTSSWNYRQLPETAMKKKLVRCSEKNCNKFHRYLFKSVLRMHPTTQITEQELYMHYCDYVQDYGILKKRDRFSVCTNFELHVPSEKSGDVYTIRREDCAKFSE